MPGEVRCPTCGRQTPIAPFCTHCGGALPEVATRPRGLDRRDLEERIRLRRGGDNPFHRGSGDWEQAAAGGGWTAFVPEPADELARREADTAGPGAGRADNLVERPSADAWGSAPAQEPQPSPPPAAAPPPPLARADAGQAPVQPPTPEHEAASRPGTASAPASRREEPYQPSEAGRYDEPGGYDEGGRYDEPGGYDEGGRFDGPDRYEEPRGSVPPGGYGPETGYDGGYGPPGYDPYEPGYGDDPPRRTGSIAILGFVVLGIAALLGGAILFSLMNSGPGTASATGTPTATAAATQQPTATETPASSGASASPSSSGGESASPSPAASAGVPADFSAQTQPCATSDMGFKGCAEDGSTINGDQVWIWVGFKNGRSSDVLGIAIVDASGTPAGDGSLELSKVGCDPAKPCSGYVQMNFSRLSPGTYDIKITLNDTDVASGSFTVS